MVLPLKAADGLQSVVASRLVVHVRTLVAAVVMVMLVGCASQAPPPPSSPSPLHRSEIPDFDRRSLDGAPIDTKALRGRVVVVEFFAEYCQPCRRTLPKAESLHRRFDDVAFIGVSEDEREAQARGLVQAYGLSFPVVHDRANVLAGRFRVSQLPVTFVIDAAGIVQWVGPATGEDDLERVLSSLGVGS